VSIRLGKGLIAAAALCAGPAEATTPRDLHVVARAVGFVNGLPRGALNVAVVDGPGADAVMVAMAQGVTAGGITLNPRRVALHALASSGARVIIVPEGQRGAHAAIATAAGVMQAVTVSTDMNCVRAGHCVVGVVSSPRVEIVVSRAAAAAADISIAQAFRVMVREI
jgi:hypothetical protein